MATLREELEALEAPFNNMAQGIVRDPDWYGVLAQALSLCRRAVDLLEAEGCVTAHLRAEVESWCILAKSANADRDTARARVAEVEAQMDAMLVGGPRVEIERLRARVQALEASVERLQFAAAESVLEVADAERERDDLCGEADTLRARAEKAEELLALLRDNDHLNCWALGFGPDCGLCPTCQARAYCDSRAEGHLRSRATDPPTQAEEAQDGQ